MTDDLQRFFDQRQHLAAADEDADKARRALGVLRWSYDLATKRASAQCDEDTLNHPVTVTAEPTGDLWCDCPSGVTCQHIEGFRLVLEAEGRAVRAFLEATAAAGMNGWAVAGCPVRVTHRSPGMTHALAADFRMVTWTWLPVVQLGGSENVICACGQRAACPHVDMVREIISGLDAGGPA